MLGSGAPSGVTLPGAGLVLPASDYSLDLLRSCFSFHAMRGLAMAASKASDECTKSSSGR